MKPAPYGRLFFGLSAVLFGTIALMWHDAQTWQGVARLWLLPFGTIAGQCLMAALILGGIGLCYRPAARWSSTLLCMVYAAFALVCAAGIVAAPRTFDPYDGFFELLAPLCGAVAANAASREASSITLLRCAAFGMGLSAACFAIAQIVYFTFTAGLVPKWIPPNGAFWAIVTTIAFLLAAAALVTGYRSRLAANLMALMVAAFGVLVWIPMLAHTPKSHTNWSEFALTLLIAGAACTLADALFPVTGSGRRLQTVPLADRRWS